MTEKSYTEAMAEVGTQMAEMRGEFKELGAELRGAIDNLTTVVEAGNSARAAESAELRKDVDDHEDRLRRHADRIADLEARPTVTPKGLWGVVAGAAALVIAGAGVVVSALN